MSNTPTQETDEPESQTKKRLWRLRSIQETVSLFAGFSAVLVAISYFIGWGIARQYYSAFGADWVTPLLTASDLLQWSAGPLSGVVTGLIATIVLVDGRQLSAKQMFWAETTTLILTLMLSISGEVLVPVIGIGPASVASGAGTFFFSFYIAFAIVRHTTRQPQARAFYKQLPRLLHLVPILWLGALISMPHLWGHGLGRRDADPEASKLVLVKIGKESWHLLLARFDRSVLVKLEKGKSPILRIVSSDQIELIQRL